MKKSLLLRTLIAVTLLSFMSISCAKRGKKRGSLNNSAGPTAASRPGVSGPSGANTGPETNTNSTTTTDASTTTDSSTTSGTSDQPTDAQIEAEKRRVEEEQKAELEKATEAQKQALIEVENSIKRVRTYLEGDNGFSIAVDFESGDTYNGTFTNGKVDVMDFEAVLSCGLIGCSTIRTVSIKHKDPVLENLPSLKSVTGQFNYGGITVEDEICKGENTSDNRVKVCDLLKSAKASIFDHQFTGINKNGNTRELLIVSTEGEIIARVYGTKNEDFSIKYDNTVESQVGVTAVNEISKNDKDTVLQLDLNKESAIRVTLTSGTTVSAPSAPQEVSTTKDTELKEAKNRKTLLTGSDNLKQLAITDTQKEKLEKAIGLNIVIDSFFVAKDNLLPTLKGTVTIVSLDENEKRKTYTYTGDISRILSGSVPKIDQAGLDIAGQAMSVSLVNEGGLTDLKIELVDTLSNLGKVTTSIPLDEDLLNRIIKYDIEGQ